LSAPDPIKFKSVAKTSKQRLESISHHFLGEPVSSGTGEKQPFFLPVLLDSRQQSFSGEMLIDAFREQGKDVRLLRTEGEQWGDSHQIPEGDFLDALAVSDDTDKPDICLIPLFDARHPYITKYGRVLLVVPATLEGIQDAYAHLKQWSQLKTRPVVGITMTTTERKASSVWLFSGKLVSGSVSFLKWQPMSFGHLLAPHSDSNQGRPIGLDEVVSLIIRDWLPNQTQQVTDISDLKNSDDEKKEMEHGKQMSIEILNGFNNHEARDLLVDSLPSFGDLQLVDKNPVLPGTCVLAVDSRRLPLVLSVDLANAGEALLAGLSAIDELRKNQPWVQRLYPDVFDHSAIRNAGVIVISREIPSSLSRLSNGDINLLFYRCQTLKINGAHRLVIDSGFAKDEARAGPNPHQERPLYQYNRSASFSEEEELFFQDL